MDDHEMQNSKLHSSKELKEHVMSHVKFPATKAEILMACHDTETPADVLKMAETHLQDKTYNTAAEALKDLHIG